MPRPSSCLTGRSRAAPRSFDPPRRPRGGRPNLTGPCALLVHCRAEETPRHYSVDELITARASAALDERYVAGRCSALGWVTARLPRRRRRSPGPLRAPNRPGDSAGRWSRSRARMGVQILLKNLKDSRPLRAAWRRKARETSGEAFGH